ncbi:MAG: hypothetical protein RMK18_01825 [Armatimonadota bacterium]|nr:hypothetical protein [Armatimonadota bacterium]MCX7776798.1 hypothetical protein [Armatimonadota bacterium]MDW8024594.1 hypothetical protein [Armatimonadota bacterium]
MEDIQQTNAAHSSEHEMLIDTQPLRCGLWSMLFFLQFPSSPHEADDLMSLPSAICMLLDTVV